MPVLPESEPRLTRRHYELGLPNCVYKVVQQRQIPCGKAMLTVSSLEPHSNVLLKLSVKHQAEKQATPGSALASLSCVC